MRNGEDWTEETFSSAAEAVGYPFRDRELLLAAFTHSSYAASFGGRDNERLEFLGDAVIELAVTEYLFRSDKADEGALTERRKQFVSRDALTSAEEKLELMRFLRHAGGESNLGGKTSSNLFEAVVGAIFLEGGYGAAKKWLAAHIGETETVNGKSLLQEYVQERTEGTPRYRTQEAEDGFSSTVTALGKSATGRGQSKKAAETEAACKLYDILTKGNGQ